MKPATLAAIAIALPACERHSIPPAAAETHPAVNEPAPKPRLDPTQPETLVGADIEAACEAADRAEIRWRIVEIDGQPRPITMDYRPDRLNFSVRDGKVIRVNKG